MKEELKETWVKEQGWFWFDYTDTSAVMDSLYRSDSLLILSLIPDYHPSVKNKQAHALSLVSVMQQF